MKPTFNYQKLYSNIIQGKTRSSEPTLSERAGIPQNKPDTKPEAVVANAALVNLRKEPKPDADIMTVLVENDKVTILNDIVDGFYPVETKSGLIGYIMADYLEII